MDPNTQVQTYQGVTRVFVPSAEFFKDALASASASAAAAGMAEADVRSNAAIAAAAAALLSTASISFTVDASLVVRPEDHGGTDAVALAAAAAAAAAAAGEVALSPNTTYLIDRDAIIPVGVNIRGPASAVVKRINQVTTTLTGSFTSGTAAKTFTVADASGFSVGQTVMFANTTTHVVSPNDSFSHTGRVITAKAGNTITIGAGPAVTAHAAGDVMATTSHMLRCQGGNILQGFTIDGNAANNTYAHWITSTALVQEGDGVRKIGLTIQNTPSDAFLCGGPSGGEIHGSWALHCNFLNIGTNGCHYGNAREIFAFGNRFVGICKRFLLAVEQGGGGPTGRGGHMDGAWIYSDDVANGTFIGNYVEDSIVGVGAMGSTGSTNINDDTVVANNIFYNCERDLELYSGTKRVVFSGNKCRADFPFAPTAGTASGNGMRWVSHSAVSVAGDTTYGRVENLAVTGNSVKNGCINLDRCRGFQVTGNVIDNRQMSGPTYNSTVNMGILLYNYEAGSVKGNLVMGGQASLWLQNSNVFASASRDTIIEGNLFLYPYLRGVSGTLVSTATLAGTVLRGNVVRGDTAATMEDGTTAIPTDVAANWRGITLFTGLQVEHNRIEFNNTGGAAWDTTIDAATNVARRWNMVNGVMELFSAFASDSAAATGNVAVGGMYRNGSVLQQRVS